MVVDLTEGQLAPVKRRTSNGARKRVSFGSNHGSMVETLIIDNMPTDADEQRFIKETIMQETPETTPLLAGNTHTTNTNGLVKKDGPNNEEINTTTTTTNISTETTNGHTDENNHCNTTTMKTKTEVHRVKFKDTDDIESHTTSEVVKSTVKKTVIVSSNNGQLMNESSQNGDPKEEGCKDTVDGDSSSPTQKTPAPPPVIRLQRAGSQESHDNPFQQDGELSKKADYIIKNSTISRTDLKIADPDAAKKKEVQEIVQEEMVAVQHSAVNASPPSKDSNARPNDIQVKSNGKVEEPLTPQSVEVEVGQANATKPEPQEAEEVKLKDPKKCKCCVVQ